MSTTTKSSIYRRTLLKDAGSYVIPVLIVLSALFFSMGNIFSVNAVENSEITPATPKTVTVSGSSGVVISGSSGVHLP